MPAPSSSPASTESRGISSRCQGRPAWSHRFNGRRPRASRQPRGTSRGGAAEPSRRVDGSRRDQQLVREPAGPGRADGHHAARASATLEAVSPRAAIRDRRAALGRDCGGASRSQTSCEWECGRLAPAARALVDERVHVREALVARGVAPCLPRLGDERELVVRRAPRASARGAASGRPPPAARARDRGSGRHAPATARALAEGSVSGGVRSSRPSQNGQSASSLGRWRLQQPRCCARARRRPGAIDDRRAGERVSPEIRQRLLLPPRSRNG